MILYTDKSELFECSISVDGTSLQNTQVRLVLESDKWNLMFYGSIDNNGKCSIDIDKLPILNEGEGGKMRLEVIADEAFFTPWEDEFSVKRSKKVTVEVFDRSHLPEQKTKVNVNVPSQKSDDLIEMINKKIPSVPQSITEGAALLKQKNVTKENFSQKSDVFATVIAEMVQKYKIESSDDRKVYMKRILDFLPR